MTKENHFAVLGLKPGASEDEIKSAYRSLAKTFHPDKNQDIKAGEKFKNITASYEYLKSKDRREMHERELLKRNKTHGGTKQRDHERERREQKERDHERERREQKQLGKYDRNESRQDYSNLFGEFKSYDEEFHSFFSEKDPFRKRDTRDIMNEFIGQFPLGNIDIGFSFGNVEKMMNDFQPFKVDDRRKFGSQRDRCDVLPHGRRNNDRGREVQFKTPSGAFTTFYSGGGKDAAFKDLYK